MSESTKKTIEELVIPPEFNKIIKVYGSDVEFKEKKVKDYLK